MTAGMRQADLDILASSMSARLLALPGVTTVYPFRSSTASAVVGSLLVAVGRDSTSRQVSVRVHGGTVVVDATIGITRREPAREIVAGAYRLLAAVLDDAGIAERQVTVRVATVD